MITKRTMINTVRILSLLSLIAIFFGCSQSNNRSKSSFNSDTGRHITGWNLPSGHGTSVKSQPDGFTTCKECHGSDFSGGISSVACSSCHGISAPHPTSWMTGTYTHMNTDPGNAAACAQCHTNGANSPVAPPSPPAPAGTAPGCFNSTLCHAQGGHQAGWNDPAQHGVAAKAAPDPAAMHGFSSCQICHGNNFSGGFVNTACSSCHGGSAPHPTSWSTGTYTHINTDTGNAAVCALCHTNGANSPIVPPSPPAPANTPPGCFNSTLCHAEVGHPVGWNDPAQHGVAAKAANGLTGCEQCHGADFTGGLAQVACSSCHTVNAPHPPAPWKNSTYMHTSADPSNAAVCGLCHLNGRTPPSYVPLPGGTQPNCFNNTLCHTKAGCYSCHGSTQNGRRVVTGLNGDFVKSDHHATNGTTTEIVTSATCLVCHGDLVAVYSHPSGSLPTIPNVQLMNPKTGASVPNDPTGVELVCSSCHDGTGATRLGSAALKPFSVDGDNTAPPNIGWSAAQQAHSYDAGTGTGGCLACHGDNSTGTGSGTANAHGSAQSKMMRFAYSTTIAAYPATNAGNFCYNCHGTGTVITSDIQTPFAKTAKHSSEKCMDCHNQHRAKTGGHIAQTNTAGGVLNGISGAELTTNPGFWAAPLSSNFTTTTIVSGADVEATLCFKCHTAYSASYNRTSPSGGYAQTDVAREFNPNNVGNFAGSWASGETAGSFHPVLASATNNLGVTNNIVAPWTTSSLMACTDCHASDTTTDPSGPHGSAANFILKGPNTTWNSSVTSLANSAWMPAGTFCLNCHNNSTTNSRFTNHSRNDHSIPCFNCHVAIPHGSEHPGLLHSAAGRGSGVPAPTVVNSAPYMRATTGSRLYIASYPTSSTPGWGRNNCGCDGSGH